MVGFSNMENVASNEYIGASVRQARKARDMDLKDVSRQLEELGHPMGVSALSKLETGNRKILAEDLPYLAAVLGVTPNVLLLGDGSPERGPSLDDIVSLAGKWVLPLSEAWLWAQGERLPRMQRSDGPFLRTADVVASRDFQKRSRPHDPPLDLSMDEYNVLQDEGALDGLYRTVSDLKERGYGLDVVRQLLEAMKILDQIDRVQQDTDASAS